MILAVLLTPEAIWAKKPIAIRTYPQNQVVGSSIGLPGMWVLAAVTVGGGISGIGGMLIGVPLTATVYKLIRSDVNKRIPDSAKGGTIGA